MTTSLEQESEKSARKPRADSVRNREKLLVAARDVFSAGGPDASLEAVARAAEVGIGTLYRHFPTREALFQAVYQREVDQLVELADRLAAEARPLDALRQWLHASIGMVATKKGMLTALAPAVDKSDAIYAESAAKVTNSAALLMAAAVADGQIRGDIEPDEVIRALMGMCYATGQPGWQDTISKLVDVFVDGLRLQPGKGG